MCMIESEMDISRESESNSVDLDNIENIIMDDEIVNSNENDFLDFAEQNTKDNCENIEIDLDNIENIMISNDCEDVSESESSPEKNVKRPVSTKVPARISKVRKKGRSPLKLISKVKKRGAQLLKTNKVFTCKVENKSGRSLLKYQENHLSESEFEVSENEEVNETNKSKNTSRNLRTRRRAIELPEQPKHILSRSAQTQTDLISSLLSNYRLQSRFEEKYELEIKRMKLAIEDLQEGNKKQMRINRSLTSKSLKMEKEINDLRRSLRECQQKNNKKSKNEKRKNEKLQNVCEELRELRVEFANKMLVIENLNATIEENGGVTFGDQYSNLNTNFNGQTGYEFENADENVENTRGETWATQWPGPPNMCRKKETYIGDFKVKLEPWDSIENEDIEGMQLEDNVSEEEPLG